MIENNVICKQLSASLEDLAQSYQGFTRDCIVRIANATHLLAYDDWVEIQGNGFPSFDDYAKACMGASADLETRTANSSFDKQKEDLLILQSLQGIDDAILKLDFDAVVNNRKAYLAAIQHQINSKRDLPAATTGISERSHDGRTISACLMSYSKQAFGLWQIVSLTAGENIPIDESYLSSFFDEVKSDPRKIVSRYKVKAPHKLSRITIGPFRLINKAENKADLKRQEKTNQHKGYSLKVIHEEINFESSSFFLGTVKSTYNEKNMELFSPDKYYVCLLGSGDNVSLDKLIQHYREKPDCIISKEYLAQIKSSQDSLIGILPEQDRGRFLSYFQSINPEDANLSDYLHDIPDLTHLGENPDLSVPQGIVIRSSALTAPNTAVTCTDGVVTLYSRQRAEQISLKLIEAAGKAFSKSQIINENHYAVRLELP